jgi:hypothetical protein
MAFMGGRKASANLSRGIDGTTTTLKCGDGYGAEAYALKTLPAPIGGRSTQSFGYVMVNRGQPFT